MAKKRRAARRIRRVTVHREDGEWFTVHYRHSISCCDCGLTHVVKFRRRGVVLQMSATRDTRSTAARRRSGKHECRKA